MKRPLYLQCFPLFADERLPAIPEWWEDVSWVNDSCPSWACGLLELYIDFEKPEDREYPMDTARFFILRNDATGHRDSELATDDWGQALRHMILHADVTDLETAKNWLRGLVLIGCDFHADDDPGDVVNARGQLFTEAEVPVVRARLADARAQDWGEFGDIHGFQWAEQQARENSAE